MSDNAFSNALDEEQTDDQPDGPPEPDDDANEAFKEKMGEDQHKEKIIGLGSSPELHAFYRMLQQSGDVDVDPQFLLRERLRQEAERHPELVDKARRIYEIQKGDL